MNPAPQVKLHGVHASAEQLARLRTLASRLPLIEGRRARSGSAGPRMTRFRGRGMDFAESRAYAPGDDVRNMDWRVTARTGIAHTKVYEEERDRPVISVVDFGPWMFFGTRVAFKSVVAASVAAMLAWAAVARGDRAGTLLFGADDGAPRRTAIAGGERGAMAVVRALAAAGAPGSDRSGRADSNPGAALAGARRLAGAGSLVFLVSDLHHLDDTVEHHLAHLRRHCDVVLCCIHDAVERSAPPPGRFAVSDGRSTTLLDTSARHTRGAWEQFFHQQRERVRGTARRLAMPLIEIATDDDVFARLRAGLGGDAHTTTTANTDERHRRTARGAA